MVAEMVNLRSFHLQYLSVFQFLENQSLQFPIYPFLNNFHRMVAIDCFTLLQIGRESLIAECFFSVLKPAQIVVDSKLLWSFSTNFEQLLKI